MTILYLAMPSFYLTSSARVSSDSSYLSRSISSRTNRSEKRDFTDGEQIRRKLSAIRDKSENGQKKGSRGILDSELGKEAEVSRSGTTNY